MFFKRFSSKEKRKKEEEVHYTCPMSEYLFTMKYVDFVLEIEEIIEDKINMLDFIMGVVRKDIQYDLMSKFLYSNMEGIYIDSPFPLSLTSKNINEPDKIILVNENKEVDLSKDTIILLPWERTRFLDTVKYVYKDKFRYIKDNHKAHYYSDIDLCYVHSGNHSITTGIIKGKGIIKAEEYDIKNMFSILTTDGLNWYLNGEKHTIEVFDFRVAILYEIAKIKYSLTNSL